MEADCTGKRNIKSAKAFSGADAEAAAAVEVGMGKEMEHEG